MSLKLVIDMNLSVEWVDVLARHGWVADHWSTRGDPGAKDAEIMEWAQANDHAVFTHDLDFGTILAFTHTSGPSVLQVRCQSPLPEDVGSHAIAALQQHEAAQNCGVACSCRCQEVQGTDFTSLRMNSTPGTAGLYGTPGTCSNLLR